MAHEEALAIVNTLQGQLASLARAVVQALSDEKISAWESMQVGMQGTSVRRRRPPRVQISFLS